MYTSAIACLALSTARTLRVQSLSSMRIDAKRGSKAVGKAVAKADLPSKVCIVCKRPFTWRKKWENCWDDVKYCSERCRRIRTLKEEPNGAGQAAED